MRQYGYIINGYMINGLSGTREIKNTIKVHESRACGVERGIKLCFTSKGGCTLMPIVLATW